MKKLKSKKNSEIDFLINIQSKGIKLGLDRTLLLAKHCKSPHENLPVLQVVGTNGKGTTCAYLSKILTDSNLKVGLFTSPHLNKINERIQINRKSISNNFIINFIKKYKKKIIDFDNSFFEVITILAFKYFKDNNVDIAIMETGLGGRLDSVSICNPLLTVFTSISIDHSEILGNSLKKIAYEKAGAIKNKIPCISYPQKKIVSNVLNEIAKTKNTTISYIKLNKKCNPNILGDFQKMNASLAYYSIKKLSFNISPKSIFQSIKNTNWPGRMQKLSNSPLFIFDVCHNQESIDGFIKTIQTIQIKGNKYLIIALQKNKIIGKSTPLIEELFDTIYCASINKKNSLTDSALIKKFSNTNNNIINISNPINIIKKLKNTDSKDMVCIIGSHYWGPIISKEFKNCFD